MSHHDCFQLEANPDDPHQMCPKDEYCTVIPPLSISWNSKSLDALFEVESPWRAGSGFGGMLGLTINVDQWVLGHNLNST